MFYLFVFQAKVDDFFELLLIPRSINLMEKQSFAGDLRYCITDENHEGSGKCYLHLMAVGKVRCFLVKKIIFSPAYFEQKIEAIKLLQKLRLPFHDKTDD